MYEIHNLGQRRRVEYARETRADDRGQGRGKFDHLIVVPILQEPVDTTGGGDSFRAGIVYGFLKDWDDGQMIEFASARAAVVCTRFPGVLDAPTLGEVSASLKNRAKKIFQIAFFLAYYSKK